MIGADDILLRDNLAMAAQLVAAGVVVDLRLYPASPHGFTGHATEMARVAVVGIDTWIDTWLHGRPGSSRSAQHSTDGCDVTSGAGAPPAGGSTPVTHLTTLT